MYMRIKIVWKIIKSGNIPNNLSKKPTIVYGVACVKYIIRLFGKGMYLSEDTDVFVIIPIKWKFIFPETENLKLIQLEGVLKFASLEACNGKKAAFGPNG